MKVKNKLIKQLLLILLSAFIIIYFSIGIVMPKILLPIYEKNIYQYLSEPLNLVNNDIKELENQEIAYLYITNNTIITSNNYNKIINLSIEQILNNIKYDHGKFNYQDKTYYYNTQKTKYVLKIAITNNDYIKEIRIDIFKKLFLIIFITLLLLATIMLLWSRNLIKKIEKLKEKIDNLGNDNYKDNYEFKVNDELKILSDSIDQMKLTLKQQEEYKNQMYQSISHDLKTPLTVIKSYIEALEDGVEDEKTTNFVIKEQVNKLEQKVHSLLYLNKLTYMKDTNTYANDNVDIKEIIDKSIEKFKNIRSDIKYEVILNGNTIFNGTADMWEAIIDNILNNFMRYTKSIIKITIKNKYIKFYNDGENIDENILNDIFTPYKKGIKGEFGLGLSIVKKTVSLFGYEISVKNEKNGVSFIIK